MRMLVVLTLVAGCQYLGSGERGSGTSKTEQRTVPPFSKVSLEGSLQADITAGSTQLVEITGDDNIVPLIVTEVSGDRLRVAPKKSIAPKLDLTARIATPKLAAVAVSGSAEVAVRGVAGDAFAIDSSGSARVTAAGTAKQLDIEVSGSSTIRAAELRAENVTVDVSGSADVDVYATGVLDVHIAGSARVRYAGSPREVRKDISGSGTLEPR